MLLNGDTRIHSQTGNILLDATLVIHNLIVSYTIQLIITILG